MKSDTLSHPNALLQPLARLLLRSRFRLFQRHRHERVVLERVAGKPLVVLPGVMNPALFRTGEFLASALDESLVPRGSAVLDMGTGSGIGAIFAAQWAARVVAVDVNLAAVRCARINVLLNEVAVRVEVREGDLFAPVQGERFDVVLFNPPFFRGTPGEGFDRAWRADDVVERFAAALPTHLTPSGHALVVLSSDGDTPAFLHAFERANLTVKAIRTHDHWNEVLTIYRLQQKQE